MQRWARRFGLRAYPPTPPSSMEPEEQEAYLSLYHLLFDPLEALRKSLLKARSAKQQAEALVQYLEEDGFIERLQATIDETYLDDPDTRRAGQRVFYPSGRSFGAGHPCPGRSGAKPRRLCHAGFPPA